MEFITVRELRINTGQVWKALEEEKELVITSSGKPIALLTGITGGNLEAMLDAVRIARGKWAIREIQKESVRRGLDKMTMKEIEKEIKDYHKERRNENRH